MTKQSIVLIKIGTKILTTPSGKLDLNNLRSIVNQVSHQLDTTSARFVIVSSGSITCGSEVMGVSLKSIPEKQAAAAIGQILLMKEYSMFFSNCGYHIGQILLTKESLHKDLHRQNIRNTIFNLIEQGFIPIINENDSVSTDEIQFGDNDELSSIVADLIGASLYITLSDIDGVYTSNPKLNNDSTIISTVSNIDDSLLSLFDDKIDSRGTGGIKSKILAAKYATDRQIETVIANGHTSDIINDVINGKHVGSRFLPNKATRDS